LGIKNTNNKPWGTIEENGWVFNDFTDKGYRKSGI
jgi:hypothetical protein